MIAGKTHHNQLQDINTQHRSRPLSRIELGYHFPLSNCPGMSIVGMRVTFPPNAATPPHRHGGASVTGYVTRGSLLNKMNEQNIKHVEAGQSWYEAPGCYHRLSENASKTDEAELVATMVVETKVIEEEGMAALVVIDEEYRDLIPKSAS